MSHDQLTSNNNVQTEEQDLDEVFDSDEPRPWFPTGDLKNLPTEIYSDCTLSKAETMSKQQKEFDKIIRNISYRTSAVLHPIDNIEKALSESKPDDNDLEAKTGYDLDLALKAISPAHTTTRDKKGVFGDKLMDLVEEKNARSKLYNDVNKEKRRFFTSNQPQRYSLGRFSFQHRQPTWRSSMITSPIPGQLKHFKATWLRKFRNSWPASIVATGYSPEWNIKPHTINKSFGTIKMVVKPFREVERRGNTLINGLWNNNEQKLHINILEMKAIHLPQPPGRCCLTRNQCNSRINMGNVPSKEDQTESPILIRSGQCDGRLCVTSEVQQTRLDDESHNIQHDPQVMGPIQSGPLCQQTECTTTDIHSWHPDPTMTAEGARNYMPNCTPMVFSELVPFANGYANRPTTALANEQPHDPRPDIRNHTETENKLPNVRVAYLWEHLQNKGLPQQAINLCCKALDPNSTSTVSSNIRAWTAWCTEHTTDPIRCPLKDIMLFLTTKAKEGKSYNTIAAYRSDISEVHEYIDNLPVGWNQDIAKLMLGIFRSNPPAESGDDIYNITPFLDYIVSLGDNSRLPLIALAKKTAFLCALSSASRPSDLARLDLTMLTNTPNSITIQCINPKEINIAI
ncbi:11901_t:CDS:2, partial [Gigaspora rosea]